MISSSKETSPKKVSMKLLLHCKMCTATSFAGGYVYVCVFVVTLFQRKGFFYLK